MVANEILLSATNAKRWKVTFDKEPTKVCYRLIIVPCLHAKIQIQKRDIDIPEILGIEVSELPDYPPKFLIYITKSPDKKSGPPKLIVEGFDIPNCSFPLITPSKSIATTIKRNTAHQV